MSRENSPGFASSNNPCIDALRACAAFLVVIYHMDQCGFHLVPKELAVLGDAGVPLFFTLSGFLIGRSVLGPATFELKRFASARARRILPNYFVCVLFALLVVDGKTIAHATPGFLAFDLATHATLMHGWFGATSTSILGPLWTLSHEWIFYILMAACGFFVRSKWGWILPLAMAVIAILSKSLIVAKTWQPDAALSHPFCQWDQFAVGIVAAWISTKNFRYHWPLLVVGIAVVLFVFVERHEIAAKIANDSSSVAKSYAEKVIKATLSRRSHAIWYPLFFAGGTACILLAVSTGFQRLGRWMERTPLPVMGRISYSTYLFHMPVLLCLMRGLKSTPDNAVFANNTVASLVALFGVYALSVFCYQRFEKPFLKRSSPGVAP
ncbi:MAG: acyltransferase family protein [Verrucomicrobiales bacterium]